MKPRSAFFTTTLCLLASLAALPAKPLAQDLSPLMEGYSAVSRTNGAPVVQSVPLAAPYVAVAFGARLAVMDMTQPLTPVEVASVDLPESPRGFSLVGTLLYVADGDHGLLVFNVLNPLNPTFVSSFVERKAVAVAVSPSGKFAYTCDGTTNLRVINIKKPEHLKELPGVYYDKAAFTDLVVAGDYLITAAGPRGICVYSLATPSNPVRVKRIKDLRGSRRIALHDRLLAVADDDAGFVLVSLPKWNDPHLKGTLPLSNLALDCAFLESDPSKVILAQGTAGFSIVDVSDVDVPQLAYQSAVPQAATSVSTLGPYGLLDCGVQGLWQADLTQPSSPVLRQLASGSSGWYGIAMSGTIAYVAGDSQVQVWNFADPYHPVEGGAVSVPAPAVDLQVAGGRLFVSCQTEGVLIYDLSNPSAPAHLGTYLDPSGQGAAAQVSVTGTLMAVAMSSQGVQLVDISDPASPQYLGAYQVSNDFASGVCFSAADPTLLWMSSGRGMFYSLDASDPTAPEKIGSVSLDVYFGKVASEVGYAFVAQEGGGGIQVVDVQDPTKPDKLSVMAGTGAVSQVISGNRALLCDGAAGLKEYDASDLKNPVQVAYAVPPGFTTGAGLLPGGQVVVATREGGLWVLLRDSCTGTNLILPCDGTLLPRVSRPFFAWTSLTDSSYNLQFSIDPSFPNGTKKTRKAKNKASNDSTGSWYATAQDWDWMIRRAAEGHHIYWRVTYKVNKVKTYSEVRSFDIQ